MAITLVPRPVGRRNARPNPLTPAISVGLAGGVTLLLAIAVASLAPARLSARSNDRAPIAGPVRVLAPVQVIAHG